MKPINCRIQDYYTQTGADGVFRIMWKYSAGNDIQTAYRIDIFHDKDILFSTGKIMSDEQNNIYVNPDLEEQTEYHFTVTAWDKNGTEETSDAAYFISGVHNWRGGWIGNGMKKPFIARKNFYAESGEKAILSVCVPGQFEIRINGKKISSYAYEGSQTDFNRRVHYSTYDATDFIQSGENEITIETANGWYIGDDDDGRRYFYTADKGYKPFGECLCVIAQLKIGNRYTATDTSWEVSRSKTVLANIYGGEDIDNTIEYNWTAAKIVPGPKGKIVPMNYPPAIHKYRYTPRCIDRKRMIFDAGQNMTAQFHLRIKGRRGQKVKVIPAEKLSPDGTISQTVDVFSLLTLSGDEDIFEQKFSVNGARWYQVEGADHKQIKEFEVYFTSSSAEDVGYFRCGDERINKIYLLILKAIESNLNHSHTDCPTIEKLGWLEPDHLMARAVMYNKDVDALWSKIAADIRDSQYADDEFDTDNGKFCHEYKRGLIPSIAPRYAKFLYDGGEGSFWDIIPWGSSVILAAYEQYLFYGNKRVLEENYESAKKYIDYLTEQYNDYDRLYGKSGCERFIRAGLGDWGIEQNKGRSRENIETAFYYHDLMTMAEIAGILGKEDIFTGQAQKVKELYNKSLLTDIGYRDYETNEITQANQAIPLCFGLVPEDSRKRVQTALINASEGKHLECGEIGLVYILRALAEAERNDIIYDMILQNDHPSYLRFVNMGETTLPEFWRDDARSRNHDMMGHIMEWFFTEIAGIKSADGFKTISLSPSCGGFIKDFECVYNSIRGKITVKYENGMLTVSTPCNTAVV